MDNNTLYRSPVRLVSYAGEPLSPYAPQTISRAKKKLLAEAALQDNELQINDVSYTKNDIITLLDSITDEPVWRYHCAVYALPALMPFLEQGYFDDAALSPVFYQQLNEDLIKFLSPWFATAFNQVSGAYIRMNVLPQPTYIQQDPIAMPRGNPQIVNESADRFEVLAALMDYQRFILPQHQHLAFERIRIYFYELLYTLRNLSWEKFREDESVLHFVFSESWISFTNKLPPAFAGTRDEVVDQVLHIALRFQHKATWYYLQQLCFTLQAVECSETNRAEVVRLENHFKRNTNIVSGNNNGKGASAITGRTIVAIIWFLLMLVRMSVGCH